MTGLGQVFHRFWSGHFTGCWSSVWQPLGPVVLLQVVDISEPTSQVQH